MKTKNCKHNSFWQVYKIINFNRTFSSDKCREFKCEKCNKICVLKWKGYKKMKKSLIKRIFTYFLWLLPAIILIVLVANGNINFLVAIGIITAFHFIAMYYIVNSNKLKIIKK